MKYHFDLHTRQETLKSLNLGHQDVGYWTENIASDAANGAYTTRLAIVAEAEYLRFLDRDVLENLPAEVLTRFDDKLQKSLLHKALENGEATCICQSVTKQLSLRNLLDCRDMNNTSVFCLILSQGLIPLNFSVDLAALSAQDLRQTNDFDMNVLSTLCRYGYLGDIPAQTLARMSLWDWLKKDTAGIRPIEQAARNDGLQHVFKAEIWNGRARELALLWHHLRHEHIPAHIRHAYHQCMEEVQKRQPRLSL